jgi:NADH:ubiquinone oxidoreductase subunit F (NADH-binding)
VIDATLRDSRSTGTPPAHRIGGIGDEGTWLLAGPAADQGPEALSSHLTRLGSLCPFDRAGEYRTVLRQSGLRGRGGGGFPLAAKLDTAMLAPGEPMVVINASESEPASRKDWTLSTYRPHLVLDGGAVIAAVVGSSEVVIHLHRGAGAPVASLQRAIAERRSAGLPDPRWRLSLGPDGYVSGEASAIVSLLGGGEARPTFSAVPMAHRGPSGRPTVVSNAETTAHVGLLVRTGPHAWGAEGSSSSPGPQLVTLAGGAIDPGRVVEVAGEATIGEVLSATGHRHPPTAVLVGGYAGTWISGWAAWNTTFQREDLEVRGAGPGCGLLGILPEGHCGLAETARLVGYLAGETAGQCGPCVQGLPLLAEACQSLAAGTLRRRGLRRLCSLADVVDGGGACRHPDGAVRLIRSALKEFADDVTSHLRGDACSGSQRPPVFPLPEIDPSDRVWR